MPSVAAFRPLRSRDYAIVWSAGLVSNIGTWLQTVAVGALVTGLTRNPIWTAVAYVAAFLPMGVLSPIGGALADRLDRRRFTIVATMVEAVLAATLAALVAAGHTSPVLVNVVVFVAGCVSALRLPFQQAMLPDLVPKEDLVGAVSLGSAQWNLGRVVGPALAGIVIVAGSFSLAFALNAVSFVAIVLAYVVVKPPQPTPTDEWPGVVKQLRAGAAAVRADPGCKAALVLIACAAGIAAPFMGLIAAMGEELVSDLGGVVSPERIAGATGALTTGQGIGAVIGSLLLPTLVERFGRHRVVLGSLVGTSLALIPYGLAPNVPSAAVAIAFTGGIYIFVLSGLSAVMQLRAPAEYRGRAISLFWAVLSIMFPIGALAQGVLARQVGMRATTIASGVALLVAVAIVRLTRPQLMRAVEDPSLEEVEKAERLVAEPEPLVP